MKTKDITTLSKLSRADFLKTAGTGVAATAVGLTGANSVLAQPSAVSSAALANAADNPAFWRRVEQLFIIDPNITFMNVGTVGSPPNEVLQYLNRRHREIARNLETGYGTFEEQRKEVAPQYGCSEDEFVITENTSDGLSKIIAGINWQEGDEIVTTNHEHPGGDVPMAIAEDRWGVSIKRVQLPVGNGQRAEDYVELFEREITSRTKAMLFSAPTYLTGTMLPIRMLAELAQRHEIISIVDGAHVPGMFDVNFQELGMDFLAGAAAKWQCAPGGAGIMYVRNNRSGYNPLPLPEFWPAISSSYDEPPDDRGETDFAGILTGYGNRSLAIADAMVKTCEVWETLGRQRIEDHVLSLSQTLKEEIADRWGINALFSPKDDERLASALTSFNPFQSENDIYDGDKSAEFVSRLEDEYGLVVRNTEVPGPRGNTDKSRYPIRISTHLFHQRRDVDRVIRAMDELSRRMR